MGSLCRILGLTVVFVAGWVVAPKILPQSKGDMARPDKTEIERGRYLVEEVAKCPECHTPRDGEGNLEPQKNLRGAPIWIMPVKPIRNWADRAPDLAGLPGMTEEQIDRVLEQGIGLQGSPIRPPMHIYHLKHEDARAIAAYLNSLRKGPGTTAP